MKPTADASTDQPVDQSQAQTSPADDQIATLAAQSAEWKNKYLRALADYQNLERRVREDRMSDRQFATEAVLVKLIPMVDSLVLAQNHLADPGLGLVIKDVMMLLSDFGAQKIDVVGKQFDPGTMECTEVVEGKNGIVVTEVGAGYMLGTRIVRPAKVKVGQEKKS